MRAKKHATIISAQFINDFVKAAQDKNCDGVIFNGYQETPELTDFFDKIPAAQIKDYTPRTGEVEITGQNHCVMTLDDKRTIPAPITGEIKKLAQLFHQATKAQKVRFTLSRIHNGEYHTHPQKFMTYPFINIGTEWENGIAPKKKPFLMAAGFKHRSPVIKAQSPRLICTIFAA